jgi:hypothetical protein
MRCLEMIMETNAKVAGISLEENYRQAKQGQYIIRHYPPRASKPTSTSSASEIAAPSSAPPFWFQFVFPLAQ